jgi:hypothetical protein
MLISGASEWLEALAGAGTIEVSRKKTAAKVAVRRIVKTINSSLFISFIAANAADGLEQAE